MLEPFVFDGAGGGSPIIDDLHTKEAVVRQKETYALIAEFRALAKSL
jgi:hypothetical protein